MTGANEIYDTIMRELDNLVLSDTDETKEKQESFSLQDEADFDDIPPSLLSYFETSRSRAAVCEKLFLEEFEDFESHHTEDMNVPIDLDNDMININEQVACDTQNEENDTSTYTRLLPAPTETKDPFIHNVSLCPNNEDEAETDEYMESEKHLAFEVRTLEISLNEEERKKSSEYEAEREKRHCEEMKKTEQKRQIERDFQKELKKLMEAEKLHQKELELIQKRAQEKLEQELLLQQELISNLQRRVEEERRMREEEQKRMKDEEDKRKREQDKIKMEAERSRMEEETRRKKEEERKMESMTLKNKGERKNEEAEKRIIESEEKKKKEEERNKIDLEKKKLEDEMTMIKQEEERKMKEEVERLEKEEDGKMMEEAKKKLEKEKRQVEKEMSLRKEEVRRKKEERKKREEENIRIEGEGRITEEIEERNKQVEMRKKKEEEDADDRKKIYKEMRKRDKKEHGNVDEELDKKKKKQENERKKREEEENEDGRKREKERKKMEEKTEVKEVVRKGDGEHKIMKEELRPIEEDEKRKNEDKRKTKEEKQRRRQEEEMRKERDEEHYRKSEEEIRLKEEKEGYKGCGVDNRKMEHEIKSKDKEKKQEEKGKRKEEIINVEAEKEQNGEEVGENKKEGNKKTEIRLKEKEESTKRMVYDREKEESVIRENELQEKRKKSMIGQNEKRNVDKTENSLASQLEDSPTWTSSNPGSLHSESTVCPTSTGTIPQQHDLDKISQASTDKTVACKNQAARPSTVSVFLPVCLPDHTEQKRLAWMKDCIPWSKLCLQNRRKQKGSVQSQRGQRRAAEPSSLPPLCPDSLLQSTGSKSLQEVTTVTLEDLPSCSLSTLAKCIQLRSLTLRRCGLKSLEGINQLPQLCYIDVQENYISFVDCENMTNLRILQLGHNKMTSIHGLTGAENLDVLDLSHNSITRIAGLESMRRLQRLSVDHNQLISTKGLREVYTLLHLSCSHNHLASVEGLENSALLNTLDLRANSLTEPPSLNNQVLLRELHLDDNCISSLTALSACWLPHMQHLSVAQNRITQLPSMSDSVSLANLDLRFNCISELQNVCESLQGCQFLREVHLTGNPLQQESGWRSTLQREVPGLRAIDKQETDSFLSPPAVQQVSLAKGSFLTFCQAQLQQTHDLQQQHNKELSNASSSLDAVKTSCRHFTEALQLAKDQRFAHEYGDTTVADKHRAAGQTTPKETLDMDSTDVEKHIEHPEMESTGKVPPVIPDRNNIRSSYWTFKENSAAESRHGTFNTVTTGPKTGPTVSKANSGSVHSLTTKGKTTSSNPEMAPVSNHQDLDLQNTAAVVIQQLWRKYRQKCGNISRPSTAEKGGGIGGDGGKPESGPSYINGSQDYAATVIQAFWRGFTLRKRLTSALAAVTCLDTGEDDTFEEVDVDEFVFDEAALEKHWTLMLSEDSPPRRYPGSVQPLSLKPPVSFPEPSQDISPPTLVRGSKQAWVAGGQVDCASPVSSIRSKYPASASVVSGLSERSEKILEEWGFTHSHTALLMLKRAQKMKSKKQQEKKQRDPSVRLALFRNCSYQLGRVEAPNRQAQYNRNHIKVCEVELGLQQAEKTERAQQEQAQQWLQTQAAHSDRDSESVHFLPEISSDILNGGRVQLVADSGYTEPLHYASGLWANNSLAAQPCKDNSYPRRNSLNHARKVVPSPKRVTSAPSKKERISFRDNPVQLSSGWGGGKKRDKVYK